MEGSVIGFTQSAQGLGPHPRPRVQGGICHHSGQLPFDLSLHVCLEIGFCGGSDPVKFSECFLCAAAGSVPCRVLSCSSWDAEAGGPLAGTPISYAWLMILLVAGWRVLAVGQGCHCQGLGAACCWACRMLATTCLALGSGHSVRSCFSVSDSSPLGDRGGCCLAGAPQSL